MSGFQMGSKFCKISEVNKEKQTVWVCVCVCFLCAESFCSHQRDRRELPCISITSPVFAVYGKSNYFNVFGKRPVLT